MNSIVLPSGDEFSSQCDLVEVTSLHRPDPSWVQVDAAGHEHRWHVGDKPATSYRPQDVYHVPTLTRVHDGWEYFEDGERIELAHMECTRCGERIEPRCTADVTRQYIPGLQRFYINGRSVTREAFFAKAREQGIDC